MLISEVVPSAVVDCDQFEVATATVKRAATIGPVENPGRFQGAWLTIHDGELTLECAGVNRSIQFRIPLDRSRPARPPRRAWVGDAPPTAAVVPMEILSRLARRLARGSVEMRLGAKQVEVRGGNFEAKIHRLDESRTASPLGPAANATRLEMDSQRLRDALAHVSLGLAFRRVWQGGLDGVALSVVGDRRVRFTTGNMLHMAVATCELAGTSVLDGTSEAVVLPLRAVADLFYITRLGDHALIDIGDRQVDVTVGAATLRTQLILQPVPSADPMLGWTPSQRIVVGPRILAKAMRRVGLVASDYDASVWLHVHAGSAIARAAKDDLGQAEETIPARVTGARCEIGLHLTVLNAMADRLLPGPVVIEFGGPDATVAIWSQRRPDLRYFTQPLIVGHKPWLANQSAGAATATRTPGR